MHVVRRHRGAVRLIILWASIPCPAHIGEWGLLNVAKFIGSAGSLRTSLRGKLPQQWHDIDGTGLGLSIVRDTAQLLGGRAWAEFPETGSVFAFSLPDRRVRDQREFGPESGTDG